jgi:hypothetical protein
MGVKIMKKLIKYRLEFLKTFSFFKDRIDGGNFLDNLLLKNIDLNKGSFYTFLPKEANLAQLYDFSYGGILPSNPIEDIYIKGLNQTFKGERINSISEELGLHISKLMNNKKIITVFDDVSRDRSNIHLLKEDYKKIVKFYFKEVYYIFNKFNFSKKVLLDVIHSTNAFWHFLCILTEVNFNDVIEKELTLDDIKEICINTKIIIVGAYDGEGYLFWERNLPRGKPRGF